MMNLLSEVDTSSQPRDRGIWIYLGRGEEGGKKAGLSIQCLVYQIKRDSLMCIIWVKAAYCGTRDSLTCPTYKMTLLHKKMHFPSMSLNLLYSNPHVKQKVWRASWGLLLPLALCVCPHAIMKRKLPGHSRDVYFWVSVCVQRIPGTISLLSLVL